MKHGSTVLPLAVCCAAMFGAAYAGAPLYRLFCSATGYGGTTQRAATAPAHSRERWVTVSFDGNVDSGLPWNFAPESSKVRVKLGEVATVMFTARNRGHLSSTGAATFNVQPDKAGAYFDKLQCFCFSRQTLAPGQSVQMPVQFYVDPALADDPQTDDVTAITLSYTFFRAKENPS